jgi:SAM-dependent methyltransferase
MKLDWHARFTQQAQWTKSLRDYLLSKLEIAPHWKILEVGCGTGAVLFDFQTSQVGHLHGIDISYDACEMATRNSIGSSISTSDVLHLPYPANTFDLVFCHYFLLWLPDPLQALADIKRILKPGGSFLVFAEPDYNARIDSPPPLVRLGELQTASLVQQGANPSLGRELPSLVSASGFIDIRYGISGFETAATMAPDWWETEWLVLEQDLGKRIDPRELESLRKIDHQCWLDGSRVLWVPTFYLSCLNPSD